MERFYADLSKKFIMKNWLLSDKLLVAFFATCLVAATTYLVVYFADYGNWFIHPHQFEIHLPMLMSAGPDFHLSSFAKIFQQFDPNENRPRFLAYSIILLNLHLRMWAYEWFVLYPPISIGWVFELLIGPWFLYLMLINFTKDRLAALAGLLVYITSIGFLSGFAMPLMPSKPLTNVVFILALFILTKINAKATQGQFFHEVAGQPRWSFVFGAVLLAGLFLDEVPIFAFILPLIFFPSLFFHRSLRALDSFKGFTRSTVLFAHTFIIFVVVVVAIVPTITKALYGYRFNFFGSALVNEAAAAAGKTFFSGPLYGFSINSLWSNFISLIGLSLTPFDIAPLFMHPSGGGVVTGISTTGPVITMTVAAFIVLTILAYSNRNEQGKHLRRAIFATLLFILFMSLLSGRHVPFISGYVYGSGICVFVALLTGLGLSLCKKPPVRYLAAFCIVAIASIQIHNFRAINASWVELHNEGWLRKSYEKQLPIALDGRPTTREELSEIWSAWHAGHLNSYLSNHDISSGAVFLIFELRHLDKWRPPNISK